MATGFFASFVEELQSSPGSAPSLVEDDIIAVLVPNTSPPDLDDEAIVNLDDLGVSVEDASHRSNPLASKTVGASGAKWFDAADIVLVAAAASANDMDVVLCRDGAGDGSRRVLMYFDLDDPVQPNGTNVTVQWPGSGICKL